MLKGLKGNHLGKVGRRSGGYSRYWPDIILPTSFVFEREAQGYLRLKCQKVASPTPFVLLFVLKGKQEKNKNKGNCMLVKV